MPSPVDALQAAGFNNDEIAAWSTERRKVLSDGGFPDNEIDAYFTGGVVAPTQVPRALEERLAAGEEAGKREGGLLQTLPQFGHLVSTPEGRGKLWEAVKQYPSKFLADMVETAQTPGDVAAGRIDLTTEDGLDRALGLGTLVGLGRFSKINKTGKTSGFALGMGDQVARVERTPTGEVFDHPVGALPNSADFVTAAKAVTEGDASMPLQQKLLKVYEEQGRLPAEVAHDAQTDPVVAQRMLSKDPADIPYVDAYHGSPHEFERFDISKIGTGEGAQSYGHGLYFAENQAVATEYKNKLGQANFDPQYRTIDRWEPFERGNVDGMIAARAADGALLGTIVKQHDGTYRALSNSKRLSGNLNEIVGTIDEAKKSIQDFVQKEETGAIYRVRILADREHFLDWDKPLSEQSAQVQAAAKEAMQKAGLGFDAQQTGAEVHGMLAKFGAEKQVASDLLRDAGVPGIKYLDQGSRPTATPTPKLQRALADAQSQLKSAQAAGDKTGAAMAQIKLTEIEGLIAGPEKQTSNFVVFDDKSVEITHKNGEPLTKAERADAMAEMGGAGGGQPPEGPVVATVEPPPPPPPAGSFAEAQAKVLDKISIGEGDRARPYTFSRLYRETIDDLHPLKAVSEDAYQMARLTRGSFGKAEQFLERSTFDFKTLKDNGRPLKEILAPVADDMNGLRAYLGAKRALEVEATGRQSGIDLEAAQRVVDGSPKELGRVAERLVNYQNRLLAYLRDSGVISGKSFDAMVEAGKAYVPFYRLMGTETGGKGAGSSLGPGNPVKRLKGSEREIIDPLESIIKNTYAYISIAERNAAGIELVEALKKQGFEVKEALTAKSDAETMAYLKEQGVTTPEALRDFVQHALPETGDTISAMRDGKRLEVTVDDPELVAAFRGLDRDSVGMFAKIFAVPAKMLRAGAVLTPEFMTRNLVRDFSQAFFASKGLFTPIDTVKGLVHAVRRDDVYQNWVKGGGANATMVALDRRYMQESLAKLDAETGLMQRAWNVISYVPPFGLKGLRMLSELAENATRLGEFEKVLAGRTSKEAIQEAAYASREVTVDFAKMGANMRAYNMITAFANPQIQGVDRIVRGIHDRPVNSAVKIAMGITLPSVYLWWVNRDDPRYQELPAWRRDLFWNILTDKWEPISPADAGGKPAHLLRQRGDQMEFNNGTIYSIPKPHELGVAFGSGVERALDAMFGNNPDALKGFDKSMIGTLIPNFTPTAVQPVIEQFANRSTFTDRTLIPADVEKQLPEYQYTPYTTELGKKLGQVFSGFPGNIPQGAFSVASALPFPANAAGLLGLVPGNLRDVATQPQGDVGRLAARALTTPILVENYVRSWTGGLGMYYLQAADLALRKQGILPDPIKPTATLADIPFVRAFVVRHPSATAQSIQDFHDDYAQNKIFFDTYEAKAKEGDVEAMNLVQKAGGPMMFVQLEGINQALSEHSKLVRDVYKNPTMPADQKRQLIDSMYFNMIQIAKGGRQIMKQAQVGLAGGPQPPQ